ncbi:MAG: DUF4089 domain-containing protein [Burkholderiales bacterium]
MNPPDPTISALLDAQSAVIGMPIDPTHRPGTQQNLELIAIMARAVMSYPLPPHIEPAQVFSHDKS